jgi:hypothetical protein
MYRETVGDNKTLAVEARPVEVSLSQQKVFNVWYEKSGITVELLLLMSEGEGQLSAPSRRRAGRRKGRAQDGETDGSMTGLQDARKENKILKKKE